MPIFLAMSCLQGRPMQDACETLLALDVSNIQLTPGNAPTEGFCDYVDAHIDEVRTHHGFHFEAKRQRVWSDNKLAGAWDSVHPPHKGEAHWLPNDDFDSCIEIMYPGEPLGSGAAVERAMNRGLSLAVDVSHVFIQLTQGMMTQKQWARLQNYERIREVHVSKNGGDKDSHQPIDANTFGLEWAKEKERDESVLILESYMHRLSDDDRRKQVELVRSP